MEMIANIMTCWLYTISTAEMFKVVCCFKKIKIQNCSKNVLIATAGRHCEEPTQQQLTLEEELALLENKL